LQGLGGEGEINLEDGADTGFAVNPDISTVALGDSIDGGEAEAGSLTRSFGGKEGLEDVSYGSASMPEPVSLMASNA
jgi:hypothetical protein